MEIHEWFVKNSAVIRAINYMAVWVLDLEIKHFSDPLDIRFFNNLKCIQELNKCIILEQYEMIL